MPANLKLNKRELILYIDRNPDHTITDIAKTFNVHKSTVSRFIRRFNVQYVYK